LILNSSLSFCCAEELSCDDAFNKTKNDQHIPEQEHEKPCSPFFTCGSCLGSIVINEYIIPSSKMHFSVTINSPFIEVLYSNDFQLKLLKPPKEC